MEKNIVIGLLAAVCLLGCEQRPNNIVVDQCKRAELFLKCMENLPAGTVSTKYNDWDEVVEACGDVAYRQAKAERKNVKPECAL